MVIFRSASANALAVGKRDGQDFIERASADACEEDHHVEFAAKQPLGEIERFGIVFDGSLAHRGRDERLATLAADQLGDLGGAAAFERHDAQTIEGHHLQVSNARPISETLLQLGQANDWVFQVRACRSLRRPTMQWHRIGEREVAWPRRACPTAASLLSISQKHRSPSPALRNSAARTRTASKIA